MIKFFIEISYWSAYFMKWKSEKTIPFAMGIGSILSISACNVLTVIILVQLYTPCPALDNCMSLIPEGILAKENKWLIVLAILPLAFVIEKLIEASIYKKQNKKDLFRYFEQMTPQRKALGKLCFVLYSVASIAIALFFANQVASQREFSDTKDDDTLRIEILEQIRKSIPRQNKLEIE